MALATVFFWMGRKVFIHIPAGGSVIKETFSAKGLGSLGKLFGIIFLWLCSGRCLTKLVPHGCYRLKR